MNESRSLIRNSVGSSDSEWLAWRISTLNMNTRSNGGRPPWTHPSGARHGRGRPGTARNRRCGSTAPARRPWPRDPSDAHRRRKTGLTAHRSTSPTADAITPRSRSNREVLGGVQLEGGWRASADPPAGAAATAAVKAPSMRLDCPTHPIPPTSRYDTTDAAMSSSSGQEPLMIQSAGSN